VIVHVPATHVDLVWHAVAPLIEKATRRTRGRYLPSDVYQEIKEGWQELWVAWDQANNKLDAAMTTQFVNYPRMRAIRVLFIGGTRMHTWNDEFRSLVRSYGKAKGASLVEGAGRKGWERSWPGAKSEGPILVEEI
jgi:hypothetical protein